MHTIHSESGTNIINISSPSVTLEQRSTEAKDIVNVNWNWKTGTAVLTIDTSENAGAIYNDELVIKNAVSDDFKFTYFESDDTLAITMNDSESLIGITINDWLGSNTPFSKISFAGDGVTLNPTQVWNKVEFK